MRAVDLESRMRELEWFHGLRALPGAWMVLRVDGRGFTRLTEAGFEKPFDPRFHEHMVAATAALLRELHGLYAFTQSDEVSVLLPPSSELFDRELEKLVSVSAGVASATFTHEAGRPAHFDGRLWLGPTLEHVVDYFLWRQADAARCALNGWCYWVLRGEGHTADQATRALHGMGTAEKNELLFARSVNFNDLPAWQRRGAGVYWERYPKEGFNPVTGEGVTTTRRRIRVDVELPKGDAYAGLVSALAGGGAGKEPSDQAAG